MELNSSHFSQLPLGCEMATQHGTTQRAAQNPCGFCGQSGSCSGSALCGFVQQPLTYLNLIGLRLHMDKMKSQTIAKVKRKKLNTMPHLAGAFDVGPFLFSKVALPFHVLFPCVCW